MLGHFVLFPPTFNLLFLLLSPFTRNFLCHHVPKSSYLIFSFYKMMSKKRMMSRCHWTSFWPELLLEVEAVRPLSISAGYCQARDLALAGSS